MKNQDQIKVALEEIVEGIQIIDSSWRYVYVNKAAASHGRSTVESLVGRTMMECYPGIDKTPIFQDLSYVMHGRKPRRTENEFEYSDKGKCWFELYIEPISYGILIRSIDITERKKLEQQLRHSQKIESVGRLAGGVAHDFNNKLAIMQIYSEMLLGMLIDPNEKTINYINKIIETVGDASRLTRQLLAFSRKQVMDPKVINLNTTLKIMERHLEALLGKSIQIEFHLTKNLKNVSVDPGQIDQVILNLCINARDAMPNGGTLRIETQNVYLDFNYSETHNDVLPGNYAMISFTDTGQGMTKDILERIFEPFFTTKEMGRGTGLGLATSHGIIKQSRGHIWVYSEPNMGSVFKVYLPAVDEKTENYQKIETMHIDYSGTETILLVEDESLLREAYSQALKNAGYVVLAVPDTESAVQVFKGQKEKIQLILTDLVLPKKSGRDLTEELQKENPDLKVIYMSGYTENTIVHGGTLDAQAILLQKPISIKSLLETVRKSIDGTLTKGTI